MEPETIDPRLLLAMPRNAEAAYSVPSLPGPGVDFMDFGDVSLNDMDFGMTKSGLMQPASVDFSTVDPNLMDLETMGYGFMESGVVDLGNTAAGDGTFGFFENVSTDDFPAGPSTTKPSTMVGKGSGNDITEVNLLVNSHMDGAIRRDNLTGLSHLNLDTRSIGISGHPQTHWSSRMLQPPVQGQVFDINQEETRNRGSTTSSNRMLPQQICTARSAARKTITLDDRREYRPRCCDGSAISPKITANDWEEYRPFVEQLYIIEGVKLTDVMKILETRFGFVASEKMYKTKIKQWGFMKNYKAGEKEDLARIVKSHRDSGDAIPQLTVRNRPAKMDRVRRFCKQERIHEEICDFLPSASSSGTRAYSSNELCPETQRAANMGVIGSALEGVQSSSLSSVPYLGKIWFDPERPFSTTSKEGRIELVLLQIKIYHEPRRPSTIYLSDSDDRSSLNCSDTMEMKQYVIDWANKLVLGVEALAQEKSARGWRSLNEACGMIHQILDQQSESLLALLFNAMSDNDWTRCPGLSTHLLRYFTKASVTRLGCKHPISVVLYHLQEEQLLADAVRSVFEVLMDGFGKNPDTRDDDLCLLEGCYCHLLIERGDYASTESHCLRFLKQSDGVFGRFDWRTREFLRTLGNIHYLQGFYELAEAKYQDVLLRGREDLGDKFPDAYCIYVLQDLAWMCEGRGDCDQGEEYWRAAIDGAIMTHGLEHEFTSQLVINLERSFNTMGKDPESWLQKNFGMSCI